MLMAVCDDSLEIRHSMKRYILNYSSKNQIMIEISEYSTGEELLNDFYAEKFSLIFLDIEMGDGQNGIAVARRIWSIDKSVAIVFLTGHDKYMLEAYTAHPFHYVIKPIEKEDAYSILDEYMNIFEEQEAYFDYHNLHIRMKSIIYIEKSRDNLVISTDTGEHTVRGTLYEVVGYLDNTFVRCHKGFVINMSRILDLRLRDKENQVSLLGCSFPISIGVKYLKDLKNAYARYGKNHWRYKR